MTKDDRDILEILKDELSFIEKGGYGRSVRTPWQPKSVFQDSLACINYADLGGVDLRDVEEHWARLLSSSTATGQTLAPLASLVTRWRIGIRLERPRKAGQGSAKEGSDVPRTRRHAMVH